jgi:hypothetical protein
MSVASTPEWNALPRIDSDDRAGFKRETVEEKYAEANTRVMPQRNRAMQDLQCAGGIAYRKKLAADGSTVIIPLMKRNGIMASCSMAELLAHD